MIQEVLQKIVNSLDFVSERIAQLETRIQNEKIRWDTYTIAAGVITVTSRGVRMIPETGTTDTLDTINGGYDGMIIVLTNNDPSYTITVSTGTGNIEIGFSDVLNNIYTTTALIYRESDGVWVGV